MEFSVDNTDRVFVKILNNYVNEQSCNDIDLSAVDMERLQKLIAIHKVSGICYSKLKEINIDDEYKQKLELKFYSEVASFQRRNIAFEKIKNLFNNNDIAHICVKGSQIAYFYPNPELRTMGDIDMLIKSGDAEKAHAVLLEDGAEYKQEHSDRGVRFYKYCNTYFEIHTNLISEELWMNGVNFQSYYADAFEHRINEKEHTFVFNNEFNIIYLLTHIAKHFYNSGCGIRMLMDIPVFVRKCGDISWDKVWKEFDRLNLTEFAAKIFMLCEAWFGEFGVNYPKKYRFSDRELVEDFILSAGVYGFYGRNVEADKIKHFANRSDGKSNYLRGMVKWAFPSSTDMRQYSSWYRNKPAILLPVAYVERFVRNARERGGVMKWGKKVVTGREDLKEKEVILSAMNLK